MENFGKIKNTFNELLAESVVSKNDTNKLLFKKYIKTIKESEILKTQFLVYNNIENKVDTDGVSATNYVNENLKLLDKFKTSDIIAENKKLLEIDKQINDKSNDIYNPILSSLHESISTLIFTKKTPKNIDKIVEATTAIVNYIKTNKKEVITEAIELPTSMLSTIMVDKYNDKYSNLDESEKKVIKTLIDSTEEGKKEVYENTIKECLVLVNERLVNTNLETKERLLKVKERLLNDKKEINESFLTNISKLIELRTTLKEK